MTSLTALSVSSWRLFLQYGGKLNSTVIASDFPLQSLVQGAEFQHILRVFNTNVDGRVKTMYALTAIKGIGRRFSNLCLKKAEVDPNKRAGELTNEELERLLKVIEDPKAYKIPNWFLNRQKDIKDGKFSQLIGSQVDSKLRDDLERLKKIRCV